MKEIGKEQALHYYVLAMARDIELIGKELAYEQFYLYGQSNGGLIVQVFATMFPKSTRSMILDTPMPLDLSDIYDTRNVRTMHRIHSLYANEGALNFTSQKIKAYPHILLCCLRQKEYRTRYGMGLTPRRVFRTFRRSRPGFIMALQKAVDEHDFGPLAEVASAVRTLLPRPPYPLSEHSRAMAISTWCNSEVLYMPWKENDTNLDSRFRMWKKDLWNTTKLAYWPFRSMEAFPRFTTLCMAFAFAHFAREALPRTGGISSDIPVLVLYGDTDGVTPLEGIAARQPVLQRQLAIVGGEGHIVLGNPCGNHLSFEILVAQRNANLSACE